MRVFRAPGLFVFLVAAPALAGTTASAPAGGLRWSAAADGALEVRNGDELLGRVALEDARAAPRSAGGCTS